MVILVVAHHGVEDVESSAGECYDRGVVTLAFLALSFIELRSLPPTCPLSRGQAL